MSEKLDVETRVAAPEKDSEVVGMGRTEKCKGIWHLFNLGVKDEFRRARIGAKLTAIRLNEIKMRGGKRCLLL